MTCRAEQQTALPLYKFNFYQTTTCRDLVQEFNVKEYNMDTSLGLKCYIFLER